MIIIVVLLLVIVLMAEKIRIMTKLIDSYTDFVCNYTNRASKKLNLTEDDINNILYSDER